MTHAHLPGRRQAETVDFETPAAAGPHALDGSVTAGLPRSWVTAVTAGMFRLPSGRFNHERKST